METKVKGKSVMKPGDTLWSSDAYNESIRAWKVVEVDEKQDQAVVVCTETVEAYVVLTQADEWTYSAQAGERLYLRKEILIRDMKKEIWENIAAHENEIRELKGRLEALDDEST